MKWKSSGKKRGMVSHQGGLLSGCFLIRVDFHQGAFSSGWSFIRCFLIRVVFYQGAFSSGWSFIRVLSHQGGLLSGCFLIRVDFHQGAFSSGWTSIRVLSHQGGLSSGGLSSGWSFIRAVFHQVGLIRVVFCHVVLSSGWSFIRLSFAMLFSHQGGLSSDCHLPCCSLIRVVFHQIVIGLLSGRSFISVLPHQEFHCKALGRKLHLSVLQWSSCAVTVHYFQQCPYARMHHTYLYGLLAYKIQKFYCL